MQSYFGVVVGYTIADGHGGSSAHPYAGSVYPAMLIGGSATNVHLWVFTGWAVERMLSVPWSTEPARGSAHPLDGEFADVRYVAVDGTYRRREHLYSGNIH